MSSGCYIGPSSGGMCRSRWGSEVVQDQTWSRFYPRAALGAGTVVIVVTCYDMSSDAASRARRPKRWAAERRQQTRRAEGKYLQRMLRCIDELSTATRFGQSLLISLARLEFEPRDARQPGVPL